MIGIDILEQNFLLLPYIKREFGNSLQLLTKNKLYTDLSLHQQSYQFIFRVFYKYKIMEILQWKNIITDEKLQVTNNFDQDGNILNQLQEKFETWIWKLQNENKLIKVNSV